MSDYGVTEKGFVLKRLDTILEEVHTELTEGFGVDTRLQDNSFLHVLVTTFCGQVAELWETAQESYYAKYPATASGLNLDNAVQYGGIRREPARRTCYLLHCTGDDGTYVSDAVVATDTSPEIRLYAPEPFWITRESFNSVKIRPAVCQEGEYSIRINGEAYLFTSTTVSCGEILEGLRKAVCNSEYSVRIEGEVLVIEDSDKNRGSSLELSDNLTTASVTTIAMFCTEEYGRITLAEGTVTRMASNITGFHSVENRLKPVYGRLRETDIELRQSYLAKSAIRSGTMIDSIVAELLNNVANVDMAIGYENDTDRVDSRGLPPHSIEIVVEGGEEQAVAEAILRKKAGGIQTHGAVEINVPGKYGDVIPVRFNRPEYLFTWLRVVLHGKKKEVPPDYASLARASLLMDGGKIVAGQSLLTQLLHEGIYAAVDGVTYIDILTASSQDKGFVPSTEDYRMQNVMVDQRQKVLIDGTRIEVLFDEDL